MSTLIVEVCKVEEIKNHPNADRLEVTRTKNWWCVTGKGQYKVGDKVVYFPPDSVVSQELTDKWGISKYCAPLNRDANGNRPSGMRIRATRFRGEPSFGYIQTPDDPNWEVGKDVKEYYGVVKWEPPVKTLDGDAASPVSSFHNYTGIENIGNFPNVFNEKEEVIVTEKIHGTNSRVGYVFHSDQDSEEFTWQWMAGSHSIRRKETNDKGVKSKYWFPFSINEENQPMKKLLNEIKENENAVNAVVCFGEIFGSGIQDMTYGGNGLKYRIFDIAVDGKYLNWDIMVKYVNKYNNFGIQTVPILYRGEFSIEKMNQLVDGPTTICKIEEINEPFKGREGIVIKPAIERFCYDLSGRVILKHISVDYHERKNKNATEDH